MQANEPASQSEFLVNEPHERVFDPHAWSIVTIR
jgi:hypothetical protein